MRLGDRMSVSARLGDQFGNVKFSQNDLDVYAHDSQGRIYLAQNLIAPAIKDLPVILCRSRKNNNVWYVAAVRESYVTTRAANRIINCSYCGSHALDDAHGNCSACGAPRG